MKDFMFIFRGGSDAQNYSPEQMQKHMQKWFAWIDKLKAKGQYVDGKPLTPAGKTVKGSNALVTDGPFAETKEQLAGYYILECKDLDEAIQWASKIPTECGGGQGSIEIRPFRYPK